MACSLISNLMGDHDGVETMPTVGGGPISKKGVREQILNIYDVTTIEYEAFCTLRQYFSQNGLFKKDFPAVHINNLKRVQMAEHPFLMLRHCSF